jgi:hypothetical protein
MGFRGIWGSLAAAAAAAALVSCNGTEPTYTIGGDISGISITGPAIVKLNGGSDISMSSDGSFTFDQKLTQNASYNVQVVNPSGRCTVANGTGTVAQSNINNVSISCAVQTNEFVIRSAILNGSKESPPVTSGMAGIGAIVVNPKDTTNITIDGGITLTGLTTQTITQVNVQLAPGGSQVVSMILAADGATAVMPAGAILGATAYDALLAGLLYFNVATAANPNGEIRGTLELQGGLAAGLASLDKLQVVPPTTSAAFGGGILIADRATRKLIITYIAHTVTTPTGASIRTTAGTGSSVLVFTNLQNNYDGSGTNLASPPAGLTLSAQNLTDFDASLLFFNVTSGAFPNGEIRGNIAPLQ